MVVRDTIGTAIYFMTYESGKQMLATFQGSTSTSPIPVAIAGGLCGLVSWACVSSPTDHSQVPSETDTRIQIYPIDSAKTHYQRNCLTMPRGQSVKMTKIQFFNRGMYRGEKTTN